VLNFEARGSRGPVAMFETSDGNAALIGALASEVDRAYANSLLYGVYRRMPNDTDLSIAKAAGHAGMNFAFVHGHADYHMPTDTPARLSADSLQHLGAYMLPLARHFAGIDLPPPAAAERHYFNPLGFAFVHYPPWLDQVLWLLVALLVAAALWRWRADGGLAVGEMLRGAAAVLLLIVWPALLIWLGHRGLRLAQDDPDWLLASIARHRSVFVGWTALAVGVALWLQARALRGFGRRALWLTSAPVLLLALLLASAGELGWSVPVVVLLLAAINLLLLRRSLAVPALAAGALLLHLLLAAALVVGLPGGAYLLLWPLLALAVAALLTGPRTPALPWLLAALPAIVLIAGTALTFDLMIGYAQPMISVLPLLLVLPLLAPLLARPAATPTALVLMLAGALAVLALTLRPPWHAERPQPTELFVLHDADRGQTAWVSSDRRLKDWHRQRLGDAPEQIQPPAYLPGAEFPSWQTPIDSVDLAAPPPQPRLRLLASRRSDQTRHLRLHLHVDGGSHALNLFLPPDTALQGWRVDGHALMLPPPRAERWWRLRGFALPADGVELELEIGGDAELPELVLTSLRYDLPPGLALPPRPPGLMRRPYSYSDGTLSMHRVSLAALVEAGVEVDVDTDAPLEHPPEPASAGARLRANGG
jgi:hypothetical protein